MATKLKRQFVQESESFVHSLLDAQDIATLAAVATRQLIALGFYEVQLLWNQLPGDMGSLQTSTLQPPDPGTLGLLESARRLNGLSQRTDPASGATRLVWVVAQNTGLWVALSAHFDAANVDLDWRTKLGPLSARCQSLLYTQRLQVDVERLASAERLQRALFAISDLASSDQSTKAVLHGLHQIVGSLMYAENFYIVRFDPEHQTIRFLYFADTHDPEVPDPDEELSPLEMGSSLTLALLRHGKPMRGPSRSLGPQSDAPPDIDLGPESEDWMGVPILQDGVVRGAVVVQSYDPSVRYSEADQALLGYVAQHILTALSRRDAQEELEWRVEARTRSCATRSTSASAARSCSAALYRIAELVDRQR